MTQINWGIMDPNSFQRGYQQSKGIVDEMQAGLRQNALEAAMRGYATDPNDPNAVNALIAADPRAGLQARQQQMTAQQAKQEKDTALIAALARDARDPATFDAAVDQVVSMGYPDAAQFKGKFNPALRSALMAAGGLKGEQQAPTSLERNYRFFQQEAPNLAPKYLENQANPPRFIPTGDGGGIFVDPTSVRGPTGPAASSGGGPEPGTVEGGYRFKGGDPARQENWEPVQGGPTASPSGGFLP